MIYLIYTIFVLLYVSMIYPKFPKYIYCKLKVDKNYLAGIFVSLGISAFANKIDYILYWNVDEMIKWRFSIVFAIITILVGIWLFNANKEKDK
jgi:hypothetical protein